MDKYELRSGDKITDFQCFCVINSLENNKITISYGMTMGCIRRYHFAIKRTAMGSFVEYSGIFGPDPGVEIWFLAYWWANPAYLEIYFGHKNDNFAFYTFGKRLKRLTRTSQISPVDI